MDARPKIARDLKSARDLKAERAAALARRQAAVETAEGVDHLVCACGSERYGIPLAAVAQVLPMRPFTPMPGAVPALLGLIALSGRIVGILGLARALGRPEASDSETGAGHLVVLRAAQPQPVALAVDRVLGIAAAPGPSAAGTNAEADPAGLGNAAASGYAPASARDGRPDFVVVDLPRLLRRVLP
ncbi:chemotaxis protein CheW [Methylobacterium pseudosasicola]|uniref:Purine-binding chemotaxis protein CheW n=1 Tax=Methylobacterium pseudosasicola TaxID=582667 RepID=A0A1I4NAM1_9HYPH|nr:chemotaxis protein CheW [Methylobacterium pseudosasicola]SFM12425.1 purine-binding chemotaxis protein CheW [Methylobacterium pseudosasicola]